MWRISSWNSSRCTRSRWTRSTPCWSGRVKTHRRQPPWVGSAAPVPCLTLTLRIRSVAHIPAAPFPKYIASGRKELDGTVPMISSVSAYFPCIRRRLKCDFNGVACTPAASKLKKRKRSRKVRWPVRSQMPCAVLRVTAGLRGGASRCPAPYHRSIGVEGGKGISGIGRGSPRDTIHEGGLDEPGAF